MSYVNGERPDDEYFGMFTCGFYQDTVTTFEGKIVAMPQNISKIPENVQLVCVDINQPRPGANHE